MKVSKLSIGKKVTANLGVMMMDQEYKAITLERLGMEKKIGKYSSHCINKKLYNLTANKKKLVAVVKLIEFN